jgi:hypothetical protein
MEALGIPFSISPAVQLLLTAFVSSLASCTVLKDSTYPATSHDISQQQADDLTTRYRQANQSASIGEIFIKPALETVILPGNISGIRYYYGIEGNALVLIIVGTELNTTTNTNDDLLSGKIIASPNSRTIDSIKAGELTRNFRNTNPTGVHGGFFSIDAVKAVLYDYKDPGSCTGLRFSYGLNAINQREIVVRGVNAGQTDINGGRIIDMSAPCPPDCGKKNIVNGL